MTGEGDGGEFCDVYVLLILIVDFFNMSIWESALKNDQFGAYVAAADLELYDIDAFVRLVLRNGVSAV